MTCNYPFGECRRKKKSGKPKHSSKVEKIFIENISEKGMNENSVAIYK